MKYIIDNYQLISAGDSTFLGNYGIGAKIPHQRLAQVLSKLQQQKKSEISEKHLAELAQEQGIPLNALTDVLMNKLKVIQPCSSRKFSCIYINSDDEFITSMLQESLEREYDVKICSKSNMDYESSTLVIFYRNNYSNEDFKHLFNHLSEDVYVITAGVVHKVLVIDNLYYQGSGLPTHYSNLNNLLACVHNDISITKNNWLLFYRKLMQSSADKFPDPQLTKCQRGYVAYSLNKFANQYTNFWKLPTTLDEINWFWHVDLTSFSILREVAIHSPYSEYDMNLNMNNHAVVEAV